MADYDPMMYNEGNDTNSSSIDKPGQKQFSDFFWLKRALIDAAKEQYFTQLSDTIHMPKHYGKTIKRYLMVPLLDDRNQNDQGIDAKGAIIKKGDPNSTGYGNLYGSSRDIGLINKVLPVVGELGGRVNRVGFTRLTLEASIKRLGFFYEWTKDSMTFDSQADLDTHLGREALRGATQLTEAILQKDLLEGAGVELFTGTATDFDEMTPEGATPSVVTYKDLVKLDQILTENRCPKQTKIISGTRMVDTKVVPACRVMYVGAEVAQLLQDLVRAGGKNLEQYAFIPAEHYAAGTTLLRGEIGKIGNFRVVQVPEMLHWAGVGAAEGTNPGYHATDGKYNVYPLLVVGDDSFNTIGFQMDGMRGKFKIMTREPGGKDSMYPSDPYSMVGMTSIQWWYGTLINRPERIAVMYTCAPV